MANKDEFTQYMRNVMVFIQSIQQEDTSMEQFVSTREGRIMLDALIEHDLPPQHQTIFRSMFMAGISARKAAEVIVINEQLMELEKSNG